MEVSRTAREGGSIVDIQSGGEASKLRGNDSANSKTRDEQSADQTPRAAYDAPAASLTARPSAFVQTDQIEALS
jgi:hypothetical protein